MPQTQEATATTILSVKWEPSNHLTQPLFSQLWGDDDAFVDIDTVTVNLMLVRQSERFRVKVWWVKTGFCFKYILHGTNISFSRGTFEDYFLFPQVGYVS